MNVPARCVAVALLTTAAVLTAADARGQTTVWDNVSSGTWSIPGNWSSGVPMASETAWIANGGTADITATGGTCSQLLLGNGMGNAASGTVVMTAGNLAVGSYEAAGESGIGAFTLSGGTNTVTTDLLVGNNSNSVGAFILNGPGLLVAPEVIGQSGTGSFTQTSGTNSVLGSLSLGNGTSGNGTYNLSGGSLYSQGYEYVGYYGNGSFTQSGGTHAVPVELDLGEYSGSSGTYNLTGGSLISGNSVEGSEEVGVSGTGTFTQSGGTNSVTGFAVSLGENPNSIGTYNLHGSGLLIASQETIGVSGSGSFTQTGGTNSASGFAIGSNSGGSGTYNLSGSGLLSASSEIVGSGSFMQSGGTNAVPAIVVGFYGAGTYGLCGSGLLTASGEILGYAGTGSFTQSAGTNAVSSGLFLTYDASSTGIYNLNGGLLSLAGSGLISGGGSAAFNFSGGTLQSASTFSSSVPIALGMQGSNGVFDTSGNTLTLLGALSGPGGLSKVDSGTLVLGGSNTYTGGTAVNGGILKLDFSQSGAPAANIINNTTNGSSLTLGGGTLAIQGVAGLSNSQSFNGLTVNQGAAAIVLASASSNPLLLSLGYISRNAGGVLDFTLPSGTLSGSNGITTTRGNINGIIGGYATVSGVNWAVSNGTANSITPYNAYTSGNLGGLTSNAALNVMPSGAQTDVTTADSFNSLNLTGSLGVAMSGSGLLQLASGGLIGNTSGAIGGGTLEGSSGTAGGELIVITPVNLTIGSVIADNGGATALTKAGSGTLILTGNNTYSGPTTIDAGSLQFSGSGTLGTGAISDNSVLVFNLSGAPTFGGAISGVGSVVKNGSGTLVLTGDDTCSGTTTISAGTLQVSGSGSLGTGAVSDGSALVFNLSGEPTFGGAISGVGSVTKEGTGTLVLSGSNNYTGGTIVDAGTLEMPNSQALKDGSSVTVGAGASLIFGSVQGATSSTGNLQAVPEPGTLALVVAAGVLAMRRPRPVLHLTNPIANSDAYASNKTRKE